MHREKTLPKSFWQDQQWILDHHEELSCCCADRWVAVVNGAVVAKGSNIGRVKRTAMSKTGRKHIPVMFIERGMHIYGNQTPLWY